MTMAEISLILACIAFALSIIGGVLGFTGFFKTGIAIGIISIVIAITSITMALIVIMGRM